MTSLASKTTQIDPTLTRNSIKHYQIISRASNLVRVWLTKGKLLLMSNFHFKILVFLWCH